MRDISFANFRKIEWFDNRKIPRPDVFTVEKGNYVFCKWHKVEISLAILVGDFLWVNDRNEKEIPYPQAVRILRRAYGEVRTDLPVEVPAVSSLPEKFPEKETDKESKQDTEKKKKSGMDTLPIEWGEE